VSNYLGDTLVLQMHYNSATAAALHVRSYYYWSIWSLDICLSVCLCLSMNAYGCCCWWRQCSGGGTLAKHDTKIRRLIGRHTDRRGRIVTSRRRFQIHIFRRICEVRSSIRQGGLRPSVHRPYLMLSGLADKRMLFTREPDIMLDDRHIVPARHSW